VIEVIERGVYEGWVALISQLEDANLPEAGTLRDLADAYRKVHEAVHDYTVAYNAVAGDITMSLPQTAEVLDAYVRAVQQIRALLYHAATMLVIKVYEEAFNE